MWLTPTYSPEITMATGNLQDQGLRFYLQNGVFCLGSPC